MQAQRAQVAKCAPSGRSCIRPRTSLRQRVQVKASASVADLQNKFGIPGSVEFVEGQGGLPSVLLKHVCGASAQVYLYGGNICSWKQASGDEVLYVRPDAVFDRSKPISGGVPHCFPQFGPGAMQQHGFARNLDWQVASTSADYQPDERDPEVELVLTENEYTLKMWPYKFKAVYSVTLHGEQLRTDLRVLNTDDKPFEFTAALHSYFEVLHVDKAKVTGLKGLTYLDKSKDPQNPDKNTESRDGVTFGSSLVDSVYLNAPEHVELEVGTGAAISIDASGWEDVVVWNPHLTLKDSYEHFVCVENAVTNRSVTVKPGESWRATTNFQVVDVEQ